MKSVGCDSYDAYKAIKNFILDFSNYCKNFNYNNNEDVIQPNEVIIFFNL